MRFAGDMGSDQHGQLSQAELGVLASRSRESSSPTDAGSMVAIRACPGLLLHRQRADPTWTPCKWNGRNRRRAKGTCYSVPDAAGRTQCPVSGHLTRRITELVPRVAACRPGLQVQPWYSERWRHTRPAGPLAAFPAPTTWGGRMPGNSRSHRTGGEPHAATTRSSCLQTRRRCRAARALTTGTDCRYRCVAPPSGPRLPRAEGPLGERLQQSAVRCHRTQRLLAPPSRNPVDGVCGKAVRGFAALTAFGLACVAVAIGFATCDSQRGVDADCRLSTNSL